MHADKQYKRLASAVLEHGKRKGDRTGTGTISMFGPQVKYDLRHEFPLLTTKRLAVKTIIHELLWFLRGDTDLLSLLENNVNIWTDDAYRDAKANGFEGTKEEFVAHVKENQNGYDMGPIYGHQWRSWPTPDGDSIDQLNDVIEEIRNNPDSRRLLVTAWNPSDIPNMALPPCHVLFQFYVQDGELSCKMYQRSADVFLGVPFNIASYAFLVHLVAKMTGLKVGDFIHTFGDTHIYSNHEGQVKEQISREPKSGPQINIKTVHKRIEDYTIDDIEIIGYDPHDAIKGKLSVGL